MVSMNSSQVQSPPWRQRQTAGAKIREQITREKIPFPESWNAAHRAERRHSCTTMASQFVRDAAALLRLMRRDRAFTSKWCELPALSIVLKQLDHPTSNQIQGSQQTTVSTNNRRMRKISRQISSLSETSPMRWLL